VAVHQPLVVGLLLGARELVVVVVAEVEQAENECRMSGLLSVFNFAHWVEMQPPGLNFVL
jgi:hypothetical protein